MGRFSILILKLENEGEKKVSNFIKSLWWLLLIINLTGSEVTYLIWAYGCACEELSLLS